jgi:hypothetical protein
MAGQLLGFYCAALRYRHPISRISPYLNRQYVGCGALCQSINIWRNPMFKLTLKVKITFAQLVALAHLVVAIIKIFA